MASAPHCIILSLSGSSASRTAPARGTKVITVRMVWSIFIAGSSFPFGEARRVLRKRSSLVRPEGTAKDHDEQHGGGPDGKPTGVGADIAGLNPADKRAENSGGCSRSRAGAVDETAIDETAQEEAGDHQ